MSKKRKKKDYTNSSYSNNRNRIISLLDEEHHSFYTRVQTIDNRSGFFITLHSVALFTIIKNENVNIILNSNLNNYTNGTFNELFISILFVTLYFVIIVLSLISIIMFVISLKSRNIRLIGSKLCEKKILKQSTDNFEKDILDSFCSISSNNEEILEKKHKYFDIGLWVTFVELLLFCINCIIGFMLK